MVLVERQNKSHKYHRPSIVRTVPCTVYSVQFTVYSVQCTVYSVQCTVYSVQCKTYLQVEGIEELYFPSSGGAWVGEETVVAVDAESAETPGVGWGVPDCVEDLHVPDVVYVEGLLQADHQPRPVQLDRKDCVAVAVLTDLGPLLEVTDPQSPGGGEGDEGQQGGGEQSLHYRHVPAG